MTQEQADRLRWMRGWDLMDPKSAEVIDAVLAEVAELQANFELRWQADRRAIAAWQAAHPESPHVWPDHADMCCWLMGEVERLRGEVKSILSDISTAPEWQLTDPRWQGNDLDVQVSRETYDKARALDTEGGE